MDFYSESEDNSDYNSDQIDSDIEVQLYGAIHHSSHSMATDDSAIQSGVSFDGIGAHSQTQDLTNRSSESQSKTSDVIESEDKPRDKELKPIDDNMKKNAINANKPLNNIFRLLDNKLDESDDEFDEEFESNNRFVDKNKRRIECIQIDDSEDGSDSDVVVINDTNFDKNNTKSAKNSKNMPKIKTKTDISLGNVENLSERTLSVMDQFYNEDDYDSEEEKKNFNAMNGDRSLWKISYTDLLVSRSQSNRYYKNRLICHNCSERGHMAKECSQPKKQTICYLCGLNGHRFDRCPSQVCSRCHSSGHKTRNCNVLVNQLVCDICGVRGHESNQCTYNWRQFHSTISSIEEPIITNLWANERKSCYNCGSIGQHFGHECRSKSAIKHTIPSSPLMLNLRKSHCFNGRESPNNRGNDCDRKALCNEFESISSNELSSRLSASFNKPLDRFHSIRAPASASASASASTSASFIATTAQTYTNNQNKHIKWIYPEMQTNGTDSCNNNQRIPITRNGRKNVSFRERTVFNDSSPELYANTSASALDLMLAQTPTPIHQQINNSMQKKSQTQTGRTGRQPNEKAKRRRLNQKLKRMAENKGNDRLVSETNISQNDINNTFIGITNQNEKKRIKAAKKRWKGFRKAYKNGSNYRPKVHIK